MTGIFWLIFLPIVIFMCYKMNDSEWEWHLIPVIMFMYVVGSMIGILIFATIGEYKFDRTDTFPIVSLKDGTSTGGSFVLGTGQIKDSLMYMVMRQNSEGLYYRDRFGADNCFIKEGCDSPYVECYVDKFHNYKWLDWFTIPGINGERISKRIVHVPTGTVVKHFTVE